MDDNGVLIQHQHRTQYNNNSTADIDYQRQQQHQRQHDLRQDSQTDDMVEELISDDMNASSVKAGRRSVVDRRQLLVDDIEDSTSTGFTGRYGSNSAAALNGSVLTDDRQHPRVVEGGRRSAGTAETHQHQSYSRVLQVEENMEDDERYGVGGPGGNGGPGAGAEGDYAAAAVTAVRPSYGNEMYGTPYGHAPAGYATEPNPPTSSFPHPSALPPIGKFHHPQQLNPSVYHLHNQQHNPHQLHLLQQQAAAFDGVSDDRYLHLMSPAQSTDNNNYSSYDPRGANQTNGYGTELLNQVATGTSGQNHFAFNSPDPYGALREAASTPYAFQYNAAAAVSAGSLVGQNFAHKFDVDAVSSSFVDSYRNSVPPPPPPPPAPLSVSLSTSVHTPTPSLDYQHHHHLSQQQQQQQQSMFCSPPLHPSAQYRHMPDQSSSSSPHSAHRRRADVTSASGPPEAETDEINTRAVAARVAAELKRYSVPQAVFAQLVLCRSQGTLSDLLRNPKPWSKLKSGRETFRRMWKWLQEPEYQRMSALRLAGRITAHRRRDQPGTDGRSLHVHGGGVPASVPLLPVGIPPSSHHHITAPGGGRSASQQQQQQQPKKPRLVFTDIQRRTLLAIFCETRRPNKDMQAMIADQLGLKQSTVANFFMNARRRSMDKYTDDDVTTDDAASSSRHDDIV